MLINIITPKIQWADNTIVLKLMTIITLTQKSMDK